MPESTAGKCIVRSKGLKNCYYYGNASYGSDLFKAAMYDKDKIPDYIKNNPSQEIIFLDTKEGLELLVDEIHNLESYIGNKVPRLLEAKEGLNKLYSLDLIQKYVNAYNRINPLIREPTYSTKNRLIESIVNRK